MTQMIDSKVVKWNSLITDDGASYRVSEPEELVELQHAQWDTLIDKLQQRLVHDVNAVHYGVVYSKQLLLLCLHQARLAGRSIVFSTCSYVCPFVGLLPDLVNTVFGK